MGRPFRYYCIVGIGLIASLAASEKAGNAEISLAVNLQIYNHSEVPHNTLIQSAQEVKKIFRKVGVDAVWHVMPLSVEQSRESLDQGASSYPRVSILITPDSAARGMEKRLGLKDNVFGLSPRPSEGSGGRLAYIFYHRVREFVVSRTLFQQEGLVLGLAIAHEVGHLLLPDHAHSRTGIMRGRLDRQDLRLAAFGDLIFTPQQAQSIRAEIARRMAEEGSQER